MDSPRSYENPEDRKKEVIDRIVSADRAAFDDWIKDPNHQRRLDMPEKPLRYLIIPERLLELADDPTQINTLSLSRKRKYPNPNLLDAIILEREGRKDRRGKAPKNGSGAALLDADGIHLIHAGLISPNDLILHAIQMSVKGKGRERLYIHTYQDREELRHQGIATSFYGRLRENAIRMGFRFIQGVNNSKNIEFFTKKLGRRTLEEIKPELQKFFWNISKLVEKPNLYTIDFLRPEDEEVFLKERN